MEYNPKDPRNILAELLNKHLPDAIQIPKLSVEDRQKFMDQTLSPEGMTLGMGLGGIANSLPKSNIKFDQADAKEFMKLVDDFRGSSDMASANIHPYSLDDYKNMITKLSDDKKTGYALKDGGELVSVFSKERGRGSDLVTDAVNSGAKKLDAYDIGGKLPELYGKGGFKELSRSKFNPEYADPTNTVLSSSKPDFVEMALPIELQNLKPSVNFAPFGGLTEYMKKQREGK